MEPKRYSRARLTSVSGPDNTGRIAANMQLCQHEHPTVDDARRCESAGEYIFERTNEALQYVGG